MNELNKSKHSNDEILQGILAGNRMWLSRGITLVESQLKTDKILAGKLVDSIGGMNSSSLRLGITGVPGVGKSTFIEALGELITSQGLKLAVLSIDPSSSLTRGSILGDKTRMAELSMNENAFIRPSPSGQNLGGVAGSTRESILLCEAAGFDVIIVETVGVGQSETLVKDMVDFFLLLMLPGSGDELQGIKRGIMEMADGIFINKSDGNMERAKRARKDFQNALHLFPPTENSWQIPVEMGSSVEKSGIDIIWNHVLDFKTKMHDNGYLKNNRRNQKIKWFESLVKERIVREFNCRPDTATRIKKAEADIASAKISVRSAVEGLFN